MITVDTLLANPQLRKGAGWRGAVTHCRRGHEYTEANTILDDFENRQCRACKNEAQLDRYHQMRAAWLASGAA